ncbi:bifunctional uridylate/adenylate kinase, partial [Cryomyces antarcticus]
MSLQSLVQQSVRSTFPRTIAPALNSSSASSRTFATTARFLEDSKPPQTPQSNPKISANYQAPPAPRPRGQSSPLRVWPFIAIFATGTFLFSQIVKQR